MAVSKDTVNKMTRDKDDRQLCARILCEVQPHGGSYFEYASFALHTAMTK